MGAGIHRPGDRDPEPLKAPPAAVLNRGLPSGLDDEESRHRPSVLLLRNPAIRLSFSLVVLWLDPIEPDRVSRLEEKRLQSTQVEWLHGRAADELPAARTLGRVYAGLETRNPDRAGRHAHARSRAARRGDSWIDRAQVREALDESEHEHPVNRSRMELDDF